MKINYHGGYNMTTDQIIKEIQHRLSSVHVGCFKGMDKPLFLISETYPGVWLEHVYDSVFYALHDRSKLFLAENTIDLFISNQKEDGQLPCYVHDGNRVGGSMKSLVGYAHTQECVSFARLGWLVYEMNHDLGYLKRFYASCSKWVQWLCSHRMTTGRGLIEIFCGWDTGHDNSGRLRDMAFIGRQDREDGSAVSAGEHYPKDDVTPIAAVDLSCNYFATLTSLSRMAGELSLTAESDMWSAKAAEVKRRLFEVCFDPDDCFFYDVDKHGNKRKFLSSTIFHLFMEGVLDKEKDAELIREIWERHIANPDEFATPYPYPSMAVCDPSCEGHKSANCWGYYSQGLIALRCTLWMDEYGFGETFDNLCRVWVEAWTEHFDKIKLGQELDPITGIPSKSSEWYSTTMLFYLYAAERTGLVGNAFEF